MSQLKVYKASAGSGKTFRLAIEYMKLALSNETNYRHILAVTFTNKATAEMKARIIGELYKLSNGYQSAYLDVLSAELCWSPMQVQLQSQVVLKRILHDYSRFSVSTIDSFFQRVIKAFNRELGINAAYNVELDELGILEEAADRLIQSVEDDPELLAWLNSFANDKMKDGRGWNLKKDIIRLGAEIYNETFKSLNNEVYEKLNDRAFLKKYHLKLVQIISRFENNLKTLGQEGLNILQQNGYTVDDFKGKGRGPATVFQHLKDLKTDFSNTVLLAATDSSAWVAASVKEPQKSALLSVVENKLMPKIQQALLLKEAKYREYISAKLIINQLYTLGILVDLRTFVKDICREKGVILISDSGHLLKDVIADSETPFVYEKTGTVFLHFMIDEFQDTSGLQWNNFRPLISNSLAENNLGMVVGDVKQAIYRWRSGDWRLLAGKLSEDFPVFGIHNEVLKSNWRSHGNIIRFNNSVFTLIPQVIQQNIEEELAGADLVENPLGIAIPEVFSDCVQEISNRDTADLGYISVKFRETKKDAEENEDAVLSELIESIKRLQDKGIRGKEMAILVRDKKRARLIADLFLEQKSLPENQFYNFDILSGESLFINNSNAIGFMISLLTCFLNPSDRLVKAQLNYLYYSKIFPQLKRLNKIPVLIANKNNEIEAANQLNLINALFPENQRPDIKQAEPGLAAVFEEADNTSNDFMQFVLSKSFQNLITGKPIPEIIYSICEQFNLFSLSDELAYLQAFVDQISVFERNHASELTSFLDWWNENGDRFTIPVSENIDAINVLTIHKSKGLEFNHVFIPFLDWSIHPQSSAELAPLLWCKPEADPFNEIELVPVRYKTDLKKSIFYKEYFTEKINTYIDNLNLMYVAFTRAKSSLFIWSSFSDKFLTVGDLLKLAIESYSNHPDQFPGINFMEHYHPENLEITIGDLLNLKANRPKEQAVTDVRISQFEFADFRNFLKIRKMGEDFFTSTDKRQSGINKGKIIHEILSLIETSDDLPNAIKRMETDGKISKESAKSLMHEIRDLLVDPEVKPWYDGSFKILNERNILTGRNGIKRPDRIMSGINATIVIDYKSGDSESDNYKFQLRSYMRELEKCGFPNVSGYIWYTRTNKRIKI